MLVLQEVPGPWQVTGILLISGGLLVMGLERGTSQPGLKLLAFAALTGLMAAAYTVVDAFGARRSGDWLAFTLWLMALDGLSFVGIVSAVRGCQLWQTIAREWRRTLVSGSLGVTAFGVFLWALSRGPVGGVSALRETSVLFASLIGVMVLKERWSVFRLAGALLITTGVAVFAIRG